MKFCQNMYTLLRIGATGIGSSDSSEILKQKYIAILFRPVQSTQSLLKSILHRFSEELSREF